MRVNCGLPRVTIYRGQVDVDDVATKVIPDDRWIMLPPNREKWGQTLFGVTAEALVLARGTNPEITREDAPGIILTRGAQDDPVQISTKGSAVAMPVLHTPDCHIVAKVL
ncbi:major capsid protein [Streptomyces sp. BE20]|uniref:major capsid protein n=1 Tax=Streptomyces sp. BE20 TaxID=3002525 RepID=UPI002E79C988|nr:major capsid protein [Streptomyces sp. BE20]MEE1820714.1 major capsid protein [Streptomyces sp. BE20]